MAGRRGRKRREIDRLAVPSLVAADTPPKIIEIHDLESEQQLVGIRLPGQHRFSYKPALLTFDKKKD